MGRKQTSAWKLFYLCIASLIFLSLWGCVPFKEKETLYFEKKTIESKKEEPPKEEMTESKSKKEVTPIEKERTPVDENLKIISESLSWAKILLERQDYDGAFKETQKVLALSGKNLPGDDALYHMGLIFAHAGNPKKDYGRSVAFFRRMIKEYPQSSLAEQAKIWIGILQENEKLNQMIQNLNLVIEESKRVDIEIEEKKRGKGK
jgi:tetratricopeptide (TPR) repeat protein